MKCEYCGKEIGLLAVRFTWIDKKNDRAVHDKCLEEFKKKTSEIREQTNEEQQIQKEDTKTINNMIKNRSLGVVLIIINILAMISYAIARITTGYGGPSLLSIILIILGFATGIELIRSKGKRQFIFGIVLLVIYLVFWILLPIMTNIKI